MEMFVNNKEKNIGWDIARLFTLAFITRVVMRLLFFVPAKDGLTFIEIAKVFRSGNFDSALNYEYHPLYPWLISIFSRFTGDFIGAGLLVSMVFAILLVIPVYMVTFRLFGRKPAVLASIFCIFQPYFLRYSSNILSESLYLFNITMILWMGVEGIFQKRAKYFVLSSVFALLAYLTRPEGLGVLLVLCVFLILVPLKTMSFSKRASYVVLLLLVFSLMVLPYLLVIKENQGEWRFTQKRRISSLVGTKIPLPGFVKPSPEKEEVEKVKEYDEYPLKAAPERPEGIKLVLSGLKDVMKKLLKGLSIPLVIFSLIGIFLRKSVKRTRMELILGFSFILYFLVLVMLAMRSYISSRHMASIMIMGCIYSGVGVVELPRFMLKFKEKYVLWTVMLLCVIGLSVKGFKPIGKDKHSRKVVGIWIKRHYPSELIMSSRMSRIPFYAEVEHFDYTDYKKKYILMEAGSRNVTVAVINLRDKSEADNDLLSLLSEQNSKEVYHKEFNPKEEIVVYELRLNE